MRFFLLAACLALAAPVAADSAVKTPKVQKLKKVPKDPKVDTQEKVAEQPAASQTCKRKVIGRGLERKVVCEFDEIVVSSHAPRPSVIVVQTGGRKVTGRPKLTDPLTGLGPHQ